MSYMSKKNHDEKFDTFGNQGSRVKLEKPDLHSWDSAGLFFLGVGGNGGLI